jgi:hypothetical protein
LSDENVKLNRDFLGKEYSTGPQLIELENIRQLALATNEKNPCHLSAGPHAELVPPPLYPVVFLPRILSQLVDDAEDMHLDILRVFMLDTRCYGERFSTPEIQSTPLQRSSTWSERHLGPACSLQARRNHCS